MACSRRNLEIAVRTQARARGALAILWPLAHFEAHAAHQHLDSVAEVSDPTLAQRLSFWHDPWLCIVARLATSEHLHMSRSLGSAPLITGCAASPFAGLGSSLACAALTSQRRSFAVSKQ